MRYPLIINWASLPSFSYTIQRDDRMNLRVDRAALFAKLSDPATISEFFDRVADDVQWTVEGVHPIAGTYTSKADFVRATFDRLTPLMRDGIHLELTNLVIDDTVVVAEFQTNSTTLDGAPYDYRLCWVCTFAGREPGDRIIAVRAYLDSVTVTWTILRNEQLIAAQKGLSR